MDYGFFVTNPASQALLKAELSTRLPTARLAFSRPGLVTLRLGERERVPDDLALARIAGMSRGSAPTVEAIGPLLEGTNTHVIARDPDDAAHIAKASAVRSDLRALGHRAEPGPASLVVCGGEEEALFVGSFLARRPSPEGHAARARIPDEAPSRAYAKLAEALEFVGHRPRRGASVVELGAAPGGATLAALEHGYRVIAVDPAAMDPRVGARSEVTTIAKAAGALTKDDLPRDARALFVDMNLAPPVSLRYVAKTRSWMPKLELVVITLKLNEIGFVATLPRWVAQVRALGFPRAFALHLPSHRSEVAVIGWVTP